jgi:hypothetical protein
MTSLAPVLCTENASKHTHHITTNLFFFLLYNVFETIKKFYRFFSFVSFSTIMRPNMRVGHLFGKPVFMTFFTTLSVCPVSAFLSMHWKEEEKKRLVKLWILLLVGFSLFCFFSFYGLCFFGILCFGSEFISVSLCYLHLIWPLCAVFYFLTYHWYLCFKGFCLFLQLFFLSSAVRPFYCVVYCL